MNIRKEKEKIAWFYWKEYTMPKAYESELEELIRVVLRIRGLETVLEKRDKILKKNETNIEKFIVNIAATDGEVLEKLEIKYDKGEVNVWRIKEEE